ncbi:hypothetical protein GCM10010195_01200 [Kitasatospora griseola]|nr:hypothetical protein GCM10010195_01200 [Kitasatospora griseola]
MSGLAATMTKGAAGWFVKTNLDTLLTALYVFIDLGVHLQRSIGARRGSRGVSRPGVGVAGSPGVDVLTLHQGPGAGLPG